MKLEDNYNRAIKYLRVSVTDRCNLRCLYCMPLGGIHKMEHDQILTYEEILRIAGIGAGLGINKIRLTGGEPLVRRGLSDFIPSLTALEGLKDVSLTTNGIYLPENLGKIQAAGINRINISLDSLKRDRYERITGVDGLRRVLAAVYDAVDRGFSPIRINTVIIKGLNDDEIMDFARLSLEYPLQVRFIEFMPFQPVAADMGLQHVPSEVLKRRLYSLGKLLTVPREDFDGPSERFMFKDAPGEIGFISPLTHHFCAACNRIRLTSKGTLRPCLLSEKEVDLKGPMRQGASDEEIERIFMDCVLKKPLGHEMAPENGKRLAARMSSIGG